MDATKYTITITREYASEAQFSVKTPVDEVVIEKIVAGILFDLHMYHSADEQPPVIVEGEV